MRQGDPFQPLDEIRQRVLEIGAGAPFIYIYKQRKAGHRPQSGPFPRIYPRLSIYETSGWVVLGAEQYLYSPKAIVLASEAMFESAKD